MIGLAPGQFPDKAWGNLCDCEITLHFALATACITDKTKQIKEVLKQIKKGQEKKRKVPLVKSSLPYSALPGSLALSGRQLPPLFIVPLSLAARHRIASVCFEGAREPRPPSPVFASSVDDICGADNGPRRHRYCARQKCGLQVASWLLRRH